MPSTLLTGFLPRLDLSQELPADLSHDDARRGRAFSFDESLGLLARRGSPEIFYPSIAVDDMAKARETQPRPWL
jgi:hypothetical protein